MNFGEASTTAIIACAPDSQLPPFFSPSRKTLA
jgi:hypothetical protein